MTIRRTPLPQRYGIGATALAAGLLQGCAPAAGHAPRVGADVPAVSVTLAGEHAAMRHPDTDACTYSAWSAPQPIPGVPAGSIMRSPSIAVRGEHGYVVGNDIYLFDSLPSPPRPLIALTLDGRDIGKPAGDFHFAEPRALVDGDGTLHVLWAEPGDDWRPVLREDWNFFGRHYASVWHATYTPGAGWSRPERVYASSLITWEHGRADMVLDSAGTLHGVIADDAIETMIYLSFTGRTWETRRIPGIVRAPVYISVAMDRDGQLYVAYVDADRSVRRDANSVFMVRSPDGGRTWLARQLISRSGTDRATQTRVLVAPDGTVHLVWAKNISGGLEPQVIRHVASGDGGETLSTPQDVDIPDGLGTLHAAVDRCGAVHVVHESDVYVEEAQTEDRRLFYARWNGGWSALESPFSELNSTEADMVTGSDGSPRVVWSVVRLAENPLESTFLPVRSRLDVRP